MENLLCDIESLDDVEKIGAESAKLGPDSGANQREGSLEGDEAEGQKGDEKPLIEDWRDGILSARTRINLPPLKPIVSPILNGGETIIIYAKTGMGKSWFALEMAKVISEGGTFLGRYSVETPRRVLYIDGEMGIRAFQERLDKLKIQNENFCFRTCDYPPTCKALDFAKDESQKALIRDVKYCKAEVVFLDNLTTLYITDKTNQQESWAIMQSFILRLRNTGLAVVIVDHAGKGEGLGPRGTSAKTDIMQTVIELSKPEDYNDEQGARFNVFFGKHRHFFGKDAKPFTAWLTHDGWETVEISPKTPEKAPNYDYLQKDDEKKKNREKAFPMFDEGKTNKEVCESLGISKNTATKFRKEWKEQRETNEKGDVE